MKSFFIYLLVVWIGADALALDQFGKLPSFIRHYKTHLQANPSLNLATFVSMHYLGHDLDDNDSTEDMKLPFKHIDVQHTHVLFINNTHIDLEIVCRYFLPDSTVYRNNYYPDPSLAGPFRPPCA